MPINGLVVMTPTSIASTGTGNSSSINADGSVDFSSCETLSLNGVFTSSYDNYMMTVRTTVTTTAPTIKFNLRVAGVNATGSNYTYQYLEAAGTGIAGARATNTFTYIGEPGSAQRNGQTVFIFGPYLAQPTAMRNIEASSYGGAYILDIASTHSLSTSYDGFTLTISAGSFSGLITVFGFNQ